MKVGQKISNETIENVAHDREIERGSVYFRHPRCGWVRISKKTPPAGPPQWIVEAVERPDQ